MHDWGVLSDVPRAPRIIETSHDSPGPPQPRASLAHSALLLAKGHSMTE